MSHDPSKPPKRSSAEPVQATVVSPSGIQGGKRPSISHVAHAMAQDPRWLQAVVERYFNPPKKHGYVYA